MSYLRFSRPEQLKGDSLRRQLRRSEDYAAKYGLILDKTPFKDEGKSAYTGQNRETGDLGRFLAEVKAGRIAAGTYLLVESLDRISRQKPMTALRLFLEIIDYKIIIVTLLDEQIYSEASLEENHFQIFGSIMVMVRAWDESRHKSDRIGQKWEYKRANAHVQKLTKRAPAWLQLSSDRSKFIEIPDRVAMVKRIFEMTLEGKGRRLIAKQFNLENRESWGVGKSKAIGWQDSYIAKILQNPAVIGVYQPYKKINGVRRPFGDEIKGYYPSVIAENDFYRAKTAVSKRQRKGGRVASGVKNLFANITFCGKCGGRVIIVDKGRSNGVYLKCSRTMRGLSACKQASCRYAPVERLFVKWVVDFDFTRGQKSLRAGYEADLSALLAKRSELETKRERIIDMIENASESSTALASRLKSLEGEIKLLTETERSVRTEIQSTSDLMCSGDLESLSKDPSHRFALREEIRNRVKQLIVFYGPDTDQDDRIRVELIDGRKIEICGDLEVYEIVDGKRVEYDVGIQLSDLDPNLHDPKVRL